MAQRQRRPTGVGPLTNVHREREEAWSVHVIRGGQLHSGYFSDAVWGGRKQALVAAQRFRDDLLRRIEPDTRVRRRLPRGVLSEPGVVGVSCELYAVEGREYERYIAHWQDPDGRPRRRRFSVGRYGRERAFALAVEAREQGVARTRARKLARQRGEAARRLAAAPPMPRRVRDPLSRKGIRMTRRRLRRGK